MPGHAAQLHLTAQHFNRFPDNRHAQSGADDIAGLIGAIKTLKNPFHDFRRHADAAIPDTEDDAPDITTLACRSLQGDHCILAGKLERIAQQLPQHRFDAITIGINLQVGDDRLEHRKPAIRRHIRVDNRLQ